MEGFVNKQQKLLGFPRRNELKHHSIHAWALSHLCTLVFLLHLDQKLCTRACGLQCSEIVHVLLCGHCSVNCFWRLKYVPPKQMVVWTRSCIERRFNNRGRCIGLENLRFFGCTKDESMLACWVAWQCQKSPPFVWHWCHLKALEEKRVKTPKQSSHMFPFSVNSETGTGVWCSFRADAFLTPSFFFRFLATGLDPCSFYESKTIIKKKANLALALEIWWLWILGIATQVLSVKGSGRGKTGVW